MLKVVKELKHEALDYWVAHMGSIPYGEIHIGIIDVLGREQWDTTWKRDILYIRVPDHQGDGPLASPLIEEHLLNSQEGHIALSVLEVANRQGIRLQWVAHGVKNCEIENS